MILYIDSLFFTSKKCKEAVSFSETVHKPRLRRFSGLFWPLFDSFFGGIYFFTILPPKKESKIGSKEPENRRKLGLWTVSQGERLIR